MEEKANNKKKKLLTIVIVFAVVLAVTATTWCPKQPLIPKSPSSPATPRPTEPPKPITCTDPTPHFASGCELLLHYDANNDGKIDKAESKQAYRDYLNYELTDKEFPFVIKAELRKGINTLCPGCYSPP